MPTSKRPLQHVARFILLALYSGTRAATVAAASPLRAEGRSYIDLERGVFYRLAGGKELPPSVSHPCGCRQSFWRTCVRCQKLGIAKTHFVEWNGKPIQLVRTGFATAVTGAKLEGRVTPHTLRHTAAAWLMQNGVPMWEAAGFWACRRKFWKRPTATITRTT
ncbi:tyrosine-type recombinase/integrase [Methylovirgula ligni]|nr:tyrosine-type recombinase/integrase [Methylovirgula ligni]